MRRRDAIQALGLNPDPPNAEPTERYAQTTAQLVGRVEAMRARIVEARVRES